MSDKIFNRLEINRIILRRFKESDIETFFRYRANPDVALYQGWENYTFEKAIKFVRDQMILDVDIPDSWFQIAIEIKDIGIHIGDCAIHTLPQDINQVEIGFTIDPVYQNKGYGTEAVKCLLGYIFNTMNKHRVIAITDVRNKDSIKLLEKIGFRREGHFIKNAWYKGEYTDEYLFALLKEEWK